MSEQVPSLHEHNSPSPSPHLKRYNLFSWNPDPCRSLDENYMDVVMFLTRSAQYRQGSMGCIIVKPRTPSHNLRDEDGQRSFNRAEFYNAIIAASTNQSLFNPMDSDIHAEIATLGECLQRGNSTKGCTVYITMPPCKRCFGALVAAGIRTIVSNREYAKTIQEGAKARNIELVSMSSVFSDDQKDRINKLIQSQSGGNSDDAFKVSEERARRKEERKRRKEDAVIQREDHEVKQRKTE
jgi:tRNA(Arg) A34 adenosine deaminase TadA